MVHGVNIRPSTFLHQRLDSREHSLSGITFLDQSAVVADTSRPHLSGNTSTLADTWRISRSEKNNNCIVQP